MQKHTILFLAADPSEAGRIALDREARAIQKGLESAGHRDCFELATRWAVEPLDLLLELRRLKPTVVHFGGHSGGGPRPGLLFRGSEGGARFVSAQVIEQTFGAAGYSVKLVVLSACYSEVQADALLAHVDCVVGMSGPIDDGVARSFAIGFYGGLGERESVALAYKQGCAAIHLEGLLDGDRPQLKVRTGVDANRLVLATANVADEGSSISEGAPDESRLQPPEIRLPRGEHGWQFADAAAAPRPLAPERHAIFIGRDAELARIDAALRADGQGRVAIVALQGMAGVGKTYLAQESYARYSGRFGCYRHLVIDPRHPGTVEMAMARLGKEAGIDAARAAPAAIAEVLRFQRALVHVDNIDSADAAKLVVELSTSLAGVPMVVTGRYTDLGTAAGSRWTRIELALLDPDQALRLLQEELEGSGVVVPPADLRELVRQVAGLPLALHLAAGYLRRGVTVDRFLLRLRGAGFALDAKDPADPIRQDRARGVLSTSFAISRGAMLGAAGDDARAWTAALVALGWAPVAGFGRSLGAAITGLSEASGEYDDFIEAAVSVSLVRRLRPEDRVTAAWTVHPLLGEFLRGDTIRGDVDARIGAWVKQRADDRPTERGARWDALAGETASVGEWLGTATVEVIGETAPSACMFAMSRGPIAPWLEAARRALKRKATAELLWLICRLAFRAGELDKVLEAATAMERLAEETDDKYRRALARSRIANVLAARDKLEEALRIHREETLPVYQQLGEEREYANTRGKVADLLATRGELEEALRIHREETLPFYERSGNAWRRVYTLGRIADLLADRGEHDEALRIRREEVLPAYEQLGDARSRANTLGKIADVLAQRGEHDEALRIWREEELPVYERIGEVRERAVVLGKIADTLADRGERARALEMWQEALGVFEKLREPQMIERARQRIEQHRASVTP